MEKNEMTIKGVVDPRAVCNKIARKTKRKTRVISPPQVVASLVSGLTTTVELNVNMHCDTCAEQLRSKILKMRGVRRAEADLGAGKVTVMGTMDGDHPVDYIPRRTNKQAKVPLENPENKPMSPPPPVEEVKKDEGGEASKGEVAGGDAEAEVVVEYEDELGMKKMMCYYQPLYETSSSSVAALQ